MKKVLGIFGKSMLAVAILLGSFVGTYAVQQNDPLVTAGFINMLASGVTRWRIEVNSSNELVIRDNTTGNRGVVATFGATGASIDPIAPTRETCGAGCTITADACNGIKEVFLTAARTTDTTNTLTDPSSTNGGKPCRMLLMNSDASLGSLTLDVNALFVTDGLANVVVSSGNFISVLSDGASWYTLSGVTNH